jgi:hypothetical protein
VSEPTFAALPDDATQAGDGLGFEAIDPLGVIRPVAGAKAPNASAGWGRLMYVMGRSVPTNLGRVARTRAALLKLKRTHSRLR